MDFLETPQCCFLDEQVEANVSEKSCAPCFSNAISSTASSCPSEMLRQIVVHLGRNDTPFL